MTLMPSPCCYIEGYLIADLSNDELADFERHLPSCAACRGVVAAEASMKRAICDASCEIESPSSALRYRIRRTLPDADLIAVISAGSHWRRIAAVAMVLGMLLTVSVSLLLPRATIRVADGGSSETAGVGSDVFEVIKPPTIQLANNKIGVPVESGDPNVSILLVYDIMQPSNSIEYESNVSASSIVTAYSDSKIQRSAR